LKLLKPLCRKVDIEKWSNMDEDHFGRNVIVGAVVLMAALFFWFRHPSTTFATDGTDASWDAAVRRSQASGRPTVVLFTADWCPTCRALHEDVLSTIDVQHELWGHYSFYKVDLTAPSPEVQFHASKLGVSAIPTMIRYDASGNETDRVHYLAPADMIKWLKAGE
jgi:thiol:disulfide interchange protein